MEFLSGLVLVMLTLVGYSGGAIVTGRGKKIAPELFDIAMIVVLWSVALVTREGLGKWLAVGIWLVAGLAIGAASVMLRQTHYPAEKTDAIPANVQGLRRLWQSWKALSLRMGNYQSRIWLALFYFLVVTPFGVLVRLFINPLHKARQTKSVWTEWKKSSADLESARSQF